MHIPRRLTMTVFSLALAAGSVLAGGTATQASANTATAAPHSAAVSDPHDRDQDRSRPLWSEW